ATGYSVTNANTNGEAAGNFWGATGSQQGFFVDTSTFAITPLGSLGGGTSKIHGLNDSGQVCGWSNLASGLPHAVSWDKTRGANNWLDLGSLGAGLQSRAAGSSSDLEVFHSVNSLGYVVGFSCPSSGTYDGFV